MSSLRKKKPDTTPDRDTKEKITSVLLPSECHDRYPFRRQCEQAPSCSWVQHADPPYCGPNVTALTEMLKRNCANLKAGVQGARGELQGARGGNDTLDRRLLEALALDFDRLGLLGKEDSERLHRKFVRPEDYCEVLSHALVNHAALQEMGLDRDDIEDWQARNATLYRRLMAGLGYGQTPLVTVDELLKSIEEMFDARRTLLREKGAQVADWQLVGPLTGIIERERESKRVQAEAQSSWSGRAKAVLSGAMLLLSIGGLTIWFVVHRIIDALFEIVTADPSLQQRTTIKRLQRVQELISRYWTSDPDQGAAGEEQLISALEDFGEVEPIDEVYEILRWVTRQLLQWPALTKGSSLLGQLRSLLESQQIYLDAVRTYLPTVGHDRKELERERLRLFDQLRALGTAQHQLTGDLPVKQDKPIQVTEDVRATGLRDDLVRPYLQRVRMLAWYRLYLDLSEMG